jgi:hypothetical protein
MGPREIVEAEIVNGNHGAARVPDGQDVGRYEEEIRPVSG